MAPSLHDLTRPPELPRTLRPSRKATSRKKGRADPGYAVARDSVLDFENPAIDQDDVPPPRLAKKQNERRIGNSANKEEVERRLDEEDKEEEDLPEVLSGVNAKVMLEDWEEQIVWEPPAGRSAGKPRHKIWKPDSDGEGDEWTRDILWELPEDAAPKPLSALPAFDSFALGLELAASNPYNVSNDKYYEVHEKGKHVRRNTFAHSVLQHATPALMLDFPFYRTTMSVDKTRQFHRPLLKRPAEDIVLTALRPAKKRRNEGIVAPKHLKELTLRDRDPYVLFEYSEEHPPLLSNIGMGAQILNYYRKRDANDNFVPELPDGEPQILELDNQTNAQEEGSLPFIVANVPPGSVLQGLTTNMFKAPVFPHSTRGADFLIIRLHQRVEARGGEPAHSIVNYYARPVETVYLVGQEIPRMEVPKPSSRRLGNMLKARMMAQAYRMIKESASRAELDLAKIYKEYEEFVPLHIRQKLRELATFSRKSSHTSMWRLAPGATLQSEAWIQKQCTPEDVCMIQSMLAGSQRLLDGGRQIMDVMGEDAAEDVDVMRDMEEDLAPWNVTRNFMHSLIGKCLLRVYGEGEPTGRGEAVNMLRWPKDTAFVREEDAKKGKLQADPRVGLAEQKQAYRSEIQRIFNVQNRSLANPEEAPDEPGFDTNVFSPYAESAASRRVSTHVPRAGSPSFSPPYPVRAGSPRPGSPPGSPGASAYSDAAMSDEEDLQSIAESSISQANGGPRALVIWRKERAPDGTIKATGERVDDPRVIREYLKARKRIDSKVGLDDKQRQQATDDQLLLLHKKAQRRNMQCTVCKQFGHMRSSNKCPMKGKALPPGYPGAMQQPVQSQQQYQGYQTPTAEAPRKIVLKSSTLPVKRSYDEM